MGVVRAASHQFGKPLQQGVALKKTLAEPPVPDNGIGDVVNRRAIG